MRLGLDIGTNSIGWCLFEIKNKSITGVVDGGVRIFHSGREADDTSLAVARRKARGMRRRRDRYLQRRKKLISIMVEAGLMPAKKEEAKKLELLDPYEIRTKGLDEKLPLTHLGRAVFHLNQRRGFKSNRKTDRANDDSGPVKDAIVQLDYAIGEKGARTYGEFLHKRRQEKPTKKDGSADDRQIPSIRTRLNVIVSDEGKKETKYDFYPDRRHLEEEFKKLWETQSKHYPDILTDALRKEIHNAIFYQRPLKAPEVGLCQFTDEKRLPKAHPLTQRRILYETVNHLRITSDGKESRRLTPEQRDQIIMVINNKKHTKNLAGMVIKLPALGKIIKLMPEERFTLQTTARDYIACDAVHATMSHPDRFGPKWSQVDIEEQSDVVSRIQNVESNEQFNELAKYLRDEYGLGEENAKKSADASLPEGYAALGLTATKRITEKLIEKQRVLTYNEAVDECGWNHSDQRTGEILEQLPYYGEVLDRHVIPGTHDSNDDDITRYGRITNPTVHIGLNQLRRLINQIIKQHGKPEEIVVELARDLKKSKEQKKEIQKQIKTNREAAIRRGEKLEELDNKIKNTGENRLILRLWEELNDDPMKRFCPYTGTKISITTLFDGSCDVDHILPYSRTLDNSVANRTLCLRTANREKADKTPWERWGETKQWETIQANLKNLPKNKRWRFSPDAMKKFEEKDGFVDRALTDTQYLSRIARQYLETLFVEGGHVWVVPGAMTEMIRSRWQLNSLLNDNDNDKPKNRTDHRHHAIDAAVVAATDRGLIQKISNLSKQAEDSGDRKILKKIPEPWEKFRDDLGGLLDRMVVSHRADHGRIDLNARKKGKDNTAGQLHNETAYGITKEENRVVSRTALIDLKPSDIEMTTRGKNIRDDNLQKALQNATEGKEKKEFEKALRNFASKPGPYQGTRRVRLVETLGKESRVEIKGKDGKVYKAYKGDSNHCYELWRMPDGKIKSQVITTFEAHKNGLDKKPHPAAKRMLRLFKRDMIAFDKKAVENNSRLQEQFKPYKAAIDSEKKILICYVQKFDVAHGIIVAPHNEANTDARHRNADDPFKLIAIGASTLTEIEARRIFVDETGKITDPGSKL